MCISFSIICYNWQAPFLFLFPRTAFPLVRMAHKHNRRRARRPRPQGNATAKVSSNRRSPDQFIISPPNVTCAASSSDVFLPGFTPTCNPPTTAPTMRPPSDIPAKLWQNHYAAWQEQQRARAAKFEAQQILLFGGEPGDDVELCYRMLEFFGRLDYIS